MSGSGERWLLQILHFEEFGVPHAEVAKFYVELHQRRKGGEKISARELLQESINRPPRDLFDPGIHPALSALGKAIESLIVSAVENKPDIPLGESTDQNIPPLEPSHETNDEIGAASGSQEIDKLSAYDDWIVRHTRPGPYNFTKPDREFLQALVKPFSMNVSALNNFLTCPLQFYFLSLLRAETGDPGPARFGSAVHHALQLLFEKMKADPHERFPFREEFIADFELYMHRHRSDFSPEEFDRRIAHGQKILSGYYDCNIQSWRKIVLIETNMRNINLGGVPSKGMIDKIEFNGSDVKIVDYKSGNHEYALKQLKRPSPEMPAGGYYWRQAVFYTLLLENRPGKKWFPTSVEISFIEPDLDGQYIRSVHPINAEEKSIVMRQIVDSWQKIQQLAFFEGCQRPDCRWCKLVGQTKNANNPDNNLSGNHHLSHY